MLLLLIKFFLECSRASPGSFCTNLAAPVCNYDYAEEQCLCGKCSSAWLSLTCDSTTTGNRVWQPTTICSTECCRGGLQRMSLKSSWYPLTFAGHVTSPNYPQKNYPNNLERTDTITVHPGKIVSFKFTAFDIEYQSQCNSDYLTITDGDGTTLMEKRCGSSLPESGPDSITSISNMIQLYFKTSTRYSRPGWKITWKAETPGLLIFCKTLFLAPQVLW